MNLAQASNRNKVRKYRKPLNINIGMVIFAVIFVYVVAIVIMYFRSDPIRGYEVQEGTLASDNIYRGIVIRKEEPVTSLAPGYILYFAREGDRVATGDLVYAVDGSGRLQEYLDSADLEQSEWNKQELLEFRSDTISFIHTFTPSHYESVYEFKDAMTSMVAKHTGSNLETLLSSEQGENQWDSSLAYGRAAITGIVSYWTDGYEALTSAEVTNEIFDTKTEYQKTFYNGNELVAEGDTAYKLLTEEAWSIVFPIDPAYGLVLEEEEYVKVRFRKNQYESWGEVKLLHNGDGNTYLELTFTNSMISFLSERFLEVELLLHEEVGLKIPISSIAQKEFYLIPMEYVIQGGSQGEQGVMRQSYLEDGTSTVAFVETEVYASDEDTGEYYIDTSVLEPGDILLKEDSQTTFTVSRRASLTGVYNMNKGYADFREIQILYQNEEYAIVKSNTMYGLNVYDYIVLDAKAVDDDQFIYQ
jgi:hypothetical protein